MHGWQYRTAAAMAALFLGAAPLGRAESPELLPASFDWLGASSCSARACHGNDEPGRHSPVVWGNEHRLWHERDKHSRAYAVLLTPEGGQIAQRLGLGPAHQAQQCLVCHAPASARAAEGCPPSIMTEGVGCESCHGPARQWIVAHTTADWGLWAPAEKEALGLRNTKDLVARVELCVDCHVGSADADVNHDLIAAGHPRLAFEFASHLHRMPLHWDEKGDNNRRQRPAFEARAWTIGQVAAAKAQLELLAARAQAAAQDRPGAVWPEFAEYSCYSCHSSLTPETKAAARALGTPAWGTWHFPLLPLVVDAPANVDPRLEALKRVMSSLTADPIDAGQAASQAAQQLGPWLAAVSTIDYDERQLRGQLVRLADAGPSLAERDWDAAAQLYLALAAFQQARLDVRQRVTAEDRAIARLLGETRSALRSPARFDGIPRHLLEDQAEIFGR